MLVKLMTKVYRSTIEDIVVIEPKVFHDSRGYFLESFRNSLLEDIGYKVSFVQENQVKSYKGALRGLHYQLKFPQGKLVWVSQGSVLDIAVDIRLNSPTFSKCFSIILDDKKHTRVYIPPGFAHGYYVISEKLHFIINVQIIMIQMMSLVFMGMTQIGLIGLKAKKIFQKKI